MTGYGKGESVGTNYQLTTEIKSVNHRFRDCRFKIGQLFFPYEIELRKKIENVFGRGSFEVYVNYKKVSNAERFDEIDNEKVIAFLGKMKEISMKADVPVEFRGSEFLRQEFQVDKNDEREQELVKLLYESFDEALSNLKQARNQEGKSLLTKILTYLQEYKELFKIIEGHADNYQELIKDRLLEKFKQFDESTSIDEPRFLQEVIYYLEKVDIHEEIDRIKTHLSKLEDLFKKDSEKGRQIDFILQELGRETNTIGSKSSISEVSQTVVQMKVRLEKIREQALNLE